jgi:hypothetical protein
MIAKETFTIANAGTASIGLHVPAHRLVGLILPALDSTTIGFSVSHDNSTFVVVYTNSGTPAAATLGTADTGSKAVAVPEEIGRLAACMFIRLNVAAQNGGARTIVGLFEKV